MVHVDTDKLMSMDRPKLLDAGSRRIQHGILPRHPVKVVGLLGTLYARKTTHPLCLRVITNYFIEAFVFIITLQYYCSFYHGITLAK
jgi:hypothetical protein